MSRMDRVSNFICHEWIEYQIPYVTNGSSIKFHMSRMDRVTNEEVRRRIGIEMELPSSVDQRVLRWCGLMERMDE